MGDEIREAEGQDARRQFLARAGKIAAAAPAAALLLRASEVGAQVPDPSGTVILDNTNIR